MLGRTVLTWLRPFAAVNVPLLVGGRGGELACRWLAGLGPGGRTEFLRRPYPRYAPKWKPIPLPP